MLYEEYDYDHCRECSCELTDDNRKLWTFFEVPMCKECYRRVSEEFKFQALLIPSDISWLRSINISVSSMSEEVY